MKKRTWLGIGALLVGAVLSLGVCISAISHTAYGEHNTLQIVLDAGHGGIDGGVSGAESGVKESDLNLRIVYCLQTALEDAGIEVTLTRKTEAGLYGTTAKHFKRRDMEKRKEIIERASPHAVVSVHLNSFRDRSKRGATVFCKAGDASGAALARFVQAEFNGKEGTPATRSPLLGDYYILNCTPYPAILVECGFLSNPDDEALLQTPAYRELIASRIAAGVLSYLAKNVSL